jgi:Fuc2NAc and GlcNAc transferase
MAFVAHLLVILVTAFLLTALLRSYALKRNVLDLPNERSSHSIPTPRGGGVSVVLTFLGALAALYWTGDMPVQYAAALLVSGSIVALIGFLDDHGHVNARWRFVVHLTAAVLVVYSAGGLPVIRLFGYSVDFSIWGWVLAVIAIVWILNLFNFMDGIDGIAGFEAVSAALGVWVVLTQIDAPVWLMQLHLYLACAVAGFLIWNHPPARIFMGDAGSGFIGLMLGSLTLLSSWYHPDLIWCWLIMLGVFIVDATYTLLVRLGKGQAFYQAHRSHAYQHAAQQYGSHWKVSYVVLLINLFWLFPWCWLVVENNVDGAVALTLAYLPLVYIAHNYRAGHDKL